MATKKKKPVDLTTEILRGIRSAIDTTNERLDALASVTVEAESRLETRIAGIGAQLVQVETRLATEIVEVARAVQSTNRLLMRVLDDQRLADFERRISELEKKAV